MYRLNDRLKLRSQVSSLTNRGVSFPFHSSPQCVSHPAQISPPNSTLPFSHKSPLRISKYQGQLTPPLRPKCKPFTQFLWQYSFPSQTYNSASTPSFLHMFINSFVYLRSEVQEPSSFSICNRIIGPFGAQKGSSTLASSLKYICTYDMQLVVLLLILTGMPRSLAGSPPKSHYAQTQGPGRISTFISCFLASSRKAGRFLFSVSKSNLPFSTSWQFQKTQTLRVLSPIALIICILCSQYSQGIRAQCTSPAYIGRCAAKGPVASGIVFQSCLLLYAITSTMTVMKPMRVKLRQGLEG